MTCKPSSLGVLSGLILKKAILISSSSGILSYHDVEHQFEVTEDYLIDGI